MNIKTFNEMDVSELMNFCGDNNIEEYTENIIDSDMADEMVKDRASGGMQSMKCFLEDVTWFGDDYYILDGYANLCNIKKADLECIKYDIVKNEKQLF